MVSGLGDPSTSTPWAAVFGMLFPNEAHCYACKSKFALSVRVNKLACLLAWHLQAQVLEERRLVKESLAAATNSKTLATDQPAVPAYLAPPGCVDVGIGLSAGNMGSGPYAPTPMFLLAGCAAWWSWLGVSHHTWHPLHAPVP